MNDGFHFLDIIFFAMVAAFLVLRLRSVLGRRTGNERPPEGANVANGRTGATVVDLVPARRSVAEPPQASPMGQGLAAIRAVDRTFDLDAFIGGSRAAFEMIVAAFARGDKAALRPLLAPDVYHQFAAAIDIRNQNGETLQTDLLRMRSVDLAAARMEGANAVLTMRFVSEQINVLRDPGGQVVEGNPEHSTQVVDEWTFSRDVRSTDPNWLLSATRSPEE